MKWHYFTDIGEFRSIVIEESILCEYLKFRKNFFIQYEDPNVAKKNFAKFVNYQKQNEDPEKFKELSNVFLFDHNNGLDPDVSLSFELDRMGQDSLMLPYVSLENLVSVGVKSHLNRLVSKILEISHNGKYKNVERYILQRPNIESDCNPFIPGIR